MDVRHIFVAASAAACILLPGAASAQGYYGAPAGGDPGCQRERTNRTTGGAVAGAIAGGVFGNQVAGRGARDEGTVLGAVVGGIVGSQIGRTSVNCDPAYAPPPPGVGGPNYGGPAYGAPAGVHPDFYRSDNIVAGGGGNSNGYGVAESHIGYPAGGSSGYSEGHYEAAGYGEPDYGEGLYGGAGASDYGASSDECRSVEQVTRMPDGREVWSEELVCLDPYTGEWTPAS